MRVVPFVIESLKVAIELGVKPQYMETHHLPNGKPYPVAFTEVPEAEFETYMSITHAEDIRDYFDRYGEVSYKEQFARCTINGNVCPLYKHCSNCKEVDDQGRLRRDMKQGIMSLDKVVEDGHDPTGCGTDTVDTLLSDLLEASSKIKADYPIIIRKVYEGYKPAEFIDELPVKKSQAYQVCFLCWLLLENTQYNHQVRLLRSVRPKPNQTQRHQPFPDEVRRWLIELLQGQNLKSLYQFA